MSAGAGSNLPPRRSAPGRVLVTGAAGFVGGALATALATARPAAALVLTDRAFDGPGPAGVERIAGDLAEPGFPESLLDRGIESVVHLASVPGSLAERDAALGWRANLMAPLALIRAAAARRRGDGTPLRFVFASSIAVYGALGSDAVTEATPTRPQLSYGAHKLALEGILSDLTRRGDLSAVSLRLPGLVARPLSESGHGSAFMSRVIRHAAAGEAYSCPVPAEARCWWMSRPACLGALRHALDTAAGPTVVQVPVLHLTVGEVARAAAAHGGHPPRITWGEDAALTALFGALPPLLADEALRHGYRPDRDAADLVAAALAP